MTDKVESDDVKFGRLMSRSITTIVVIACISLLAGCVIDNYMTLEAAKYGWKRAQSFPSRFVPAEQEAKP